LRAVPPSHCSSRYSRRWHERLGPCPRGRWLRSPFLARPEHRRAEQVFLDRRCELHFGEPLPWERQPPLAALSGMLSRRGSPPRVKPEKLALSICCPVCSYKRTSACDLERSVSCQQRTHAPQQTTSPFYELIAGTQSGAGADYMTSLLLIAALAELCSEQAAACLVRGKA
jgi:hypothetical protein